VPQNFLWGDQQEASKLQLSAQIAPRSEVAWLKRIFRFNFIFLILMGLSVLAWGVEALEHEIKATYLYNFAKFTEWPISKLPQGAPLVICILGDDPFKGSLANLVRGKSIESHPLEVRHLGPLETTSSCGILFVGAGQSKNFQKIQASLPSHSTLMVGEASDFLQNGGQIQFFIEASKVRFEINLAAVEKAGLKIDARVLNIAKIRK